MAHSLSAKKRIRQNVKQRARNRARKSGMRDEIKSFTALLTGGKLADAEKQLKKVVQHLDRVSARGTIHRNAASRKRSRLTRKLNAAKRAPAAGKQGAAAGG